MTEDLFERARREAHALAARRTRTPSAATGCSEDTCGLRRPAELVMGDELNDVASDPRMTQASPGAVLQPGEAIVAHSFERPVHRSCRRTCW
jgi:hypothetical protein